MAEMEICDENKGGEHLQHIQSNTTVAQEKLVCVNVILNVGTPAKAR